MGGAVFVVAGPSTAQQGPIASMVSTAGWARAAERVLGRAWIVTPAGLIDPDDALGRGSDPTLAPHAGRSIRAMAPAVVKTMVKDVRQLRGARRFRIEPEPEWREVPPRFVWQRHQLFHDAGIRLACELGVPSVIFVPATMVWEAAQWGTRRPGWSGSAERRGERPALTAADVVACGTPEVAEQVVRLGVDEARVVITPTGVDLASFDRPVDRTAIRETLGLADRFVIGWVGSFRRFHALERAVEAAGAVDGACLLLVGDGPERPAIERLAASRGVEVVATGTVAHAELREVLAAMDVGVVLSRQDEVFHYSPLKVAEYLAAGVPVVAPDVGQLGERLQHGVDAMLVAPGDTAELVDVLCQLRDDAPMRARLGAEGQRSAARSWSWDRQVRRVVAAIDGGAPEA